MSRPNPFRAVVYAASMYGVKGLRSRGVYIDKETFDLALTAIWALADDRLHPVPVVEPKRNSEDTSSMSTTDVAQMTDVTPRAVRKAAAAGHLQGSQDDAGRWCFTLEAVEEWRSS